MTSPQPQIAPGTITVVLDVSGNGTAKLGPIGAREIWFPSSASVSVSRPIVNEAECRLYVGDSATPGNFRDGTLSGSTGDSSGRVAGQVTLGAFIWAVWAGGDPGMVATLNVYGNKNV